MFRRLVQANPSGMTVGLDLSPNMAAQTQRDVRKQFPGSQAFCEAVDVRHMPFRDESFDAVMCCYLFELLPEEDVRRTLSEIRRVLKPGGQFSVVLIGENSAAFNVGYRICGGLVPSFWGRQVEERAAAMVNDVLPVVTDKRVRQGYYPSRVLVARKP
jgi:ubiquinone/menaquinone biosynthesis C-methylase UbiE